MDPDRCQIEFNRLTQGVATRVLGQTQVKLVMELLRSVGQIAPLLPCCKSGQPPLFVNLAGQSSYFFPSGVCRGHDEEPGGLRFERRSQYNGSADVLDARYANARADSRFAFHQTFCLQSLKRLGDGLDT